MAYRGETVKMRIVGDETFDPSSLDFFVAVYPDRHPESAIFIEKGEMEGVASDEYIAKLAPDVTASMPLGLYTVELMIHEQNGDRSIFAKQGAFPMYDSASKDY